jgi:RNase P subunit RPR2
MTVDEQWMLWHRYRLLVKEEKVRAISCPDCDTALITRVKGTVDDTPHLWCHICDTFLRPGLDVYSRVRAVVTEHYL